MIDHDSAGAMHKSCSQIGADSAAIVHILMNQAIHTPLLFCDAALFMKENLPFVHIWSVFENVLSFFMITVL